MAHLKDKPAINHNNEKEQNENLALLAQICQEGYKRGIKNKNVAYLKDELLDKDIIVTEKIPNPDHSRCAGAEDERENEERICRCMYYYNKGTGCSQECPLKRKWHLVGEGEILDHAKPMKNLSGGIGEIDLQIKYDGEEYSVEVKPPEGNKDSVCRMIAEIMTYTIDYPYAPAIAVFEGSDQYKRITRIVETDNPNFEIIRKYIKIFLIKVVEEKAGIVDFRIDTL